MSSSRPSNRPSKRPRTTGPEEAEDPALPVLDATNSSTVWYNDGSIVLQAENTRFRVHRTVMALNSPIFEDMLHIGQSPGEDSVEECPLVVLHDSAEDLEAILRALYDRRYFDPEENQPLSLIASILRLSKKYEIQHLYNKALKFLTDQFPDTLEARDACGPSRVVESAGFSFDVITLARELDIQQILPAAFYRFIMLYDDAVILDGLPDPTGEQMTKLSPLDQKVAILGRQNVIKLSASTTYAWLDEEKTSEHCKQKLACTMGYHDISNGLWKPLPRCAALSQWRSEWNHWLCSRCRQDAIECHNSGRARFWSKLPECFDLPPWPDS
ncbi:hypothetical protein PLICRDRAFT_118797 [Plicaturopsis crispa FD-325 SS-3]|uniref:BTB domain-containing protein n=1 Tax=Plicaturopsis crispa FD-325 SS-3 TaxID=944288 RepID=A0A0C9T773_PLICR|nr:hypothetical protein PLICRDRAFT_118797 [Plicaturopsis crispa FD-325 SS-3]